jgi:mRNA-degrading endonuclease toxin of MazEF toxin-antitoxin module
MTVTVRRGSVLKICLDPVTGHEQGGNLRPCVLVSDPTLAHDQRYSILVIVPFTGTLDLGPLYPIVKPFPRGLTKPSTALVDQIRAIDARRVGGVLAPLPADDMKMVENALRKILVL